MSAQSVFAVVIYWAYYGGIDEMAVFSTRDKAEAYAKETMANSSGYDGDMYEIEEREVDAP